MRLLYAASLVGQLLAIAPAIAQTPAGARELTGQIFRGLVKAGRNKEFHFTSPSSQFISIILDGAQSEVRFRIQSPTGKVLAEGSPPQGEYGVGILSAVLPEAGEYIVGVDSRG